MNYSKEEFFDLMEQAEEQGIEHLDEVCTPKQYEFTGRARPVVMRACKNAALFAIPHDDGVVKVCAVDDSMGRWPRFGGDRFGREAENA